MQRQREKAGAGHRLSTLASGFLRFGGGMYPKSNVTWLATIPSAVRLKRSPDG